MVWRRLTAFCKLVIFLVVKGLREQITVRGRKYRSDNKHHKIT